MRLHEQVFSSIEYRRWICICSWRSGERKRWIKQDLRTTRGLVICAECDLLAEVSHISSLAESMYGMSGCLQTLLVRREQLDFPSPYLIPRVLKHMEQGMEMGTLVIPLWTSAPWWPLITTGGTKPIGSKLHLTRICSSHTFRSHQVPLP